MEQEITLNIRYDIPEQEWNKIKAVYQSMDGWLGNENEAMWFGRYGDERYIEASVEPSGLLLCCRLEPRFWMGWLTVFCARMSLALDREVHDAEM